MFWFIFKKFMFLFNWWINFISEIFLFFLWWVLIVECRKFVFVILLILFGYCIVRNRFVWVCLFIFILSIFLLFSVMFFCVILYLGCFMIVEDNVDLLVLFGFMIVWILLFLIFKLIFFKIFLFLIVIWRFLIVKVDFVILKFLVIDVYSKKWYIYIFLIIFILFLL